MLNYYYAFQKLWEEFDEVQVVHICWDINDKAYNLAMLAASPRPKKLKIFILHILLILKLSTNECLKIETEELETWKTIIIEYLLKGMLLRDKEKAKKLSTWAARYVIIVNKLHRWGFSSLLLKCLNKEQVDYVIKELHEGMWGMHLRGRTMASRVIRVECYWPTLRTKYLDFVKKSLKCQKHGNLVH